MMVVFSRLGLSSVSSCIAGLSQVGSLPNEMVRRKEFQRGGSVLQVERDPKERIALVEMKR